MNQDPPEYDKIIQKESKEREVLELLNSQIEQFFANSNEPHGRAYYSLYQGIINDNPTLTASALEEYPELFNTTFKIEVKGKERTLSPLMLAVEIEAYNAIKSIVGEDIEQKNNKPINKVDVNQTNEKGKTPLIKAASKGNLTIVDFLINRGANLTISYQGKRRDITALDVAQKKGYSEICASLKKALNNKPPTSIEPKQSHNPAQEQQAR